MQKRSPPQNKEKAPPTRVRSARGNLISAGLYKRLEQQNKDRESLRQEDNLYGLTTKELIAKYQQFVEAMVQIPSGIAAINKMITEYYASRKKAYQTGEKLGELPGKLACRCKLAECGECQIKALRVELVAHRREQFSQAEKIRSVLVNFIQQHSAIRTATPPPTTNGWTVMNCDSRNSYPNCRQRRKARRRQRVLLRQVAQLQVLTPNPASGEPSDQDQYLQHQRFLRELFNLLENTYSPLLGVPPAPILQ
ncbi:uncharacterized protein LOC112905177 [Agrilus planipennis]|uniref:Uncharacterized protein LOC112905177 n=1 Tax=Agrilus planipennis TaxID=224129 RepID=A0A7F5RA88_AGRPL|nr:uncharacterized protein LOC112905177 [Agrilus planipennis]